LLSERAAAVVPGSRSMQRMQRRYSSSAGVWPGSLWQSNLAAVRLGALSLDQLNQGLASELSTLGSGNRGAEARKQTLEANIGWSYGLLEEAERLLWA
jgi:hypothetical protein